MKELRSVDDSITDPSSYSFLFGGIPGFLCSEKRSCATEYGTFYLTGQRFPPFDLILFHHQLHRASKVCIGIIADQSQPPMPFEEDKRIRNKHFSIARHRLFLPPTSRLSKRLLFPEKSIRGALHCANRFPIGRQTLLDRVHPLENCSSIILPEAITYIPLSLWRLTRFGLAIVCPPNINGWWT